MGNVALCPCQAEQVQTLQVSLPVDASHAESLAAPIEPSEPSAPSDAPAPPEPPAPPPPPPPAKVSLIKEEVQGSELGEQLFLLILDKLEQNEEFDSTSEVNSDSDSEASSTSSTRSCKALTPTVLDEYGEPLQEWELVAASSKLNRRQLPSRFVAGRILRSAELMFRQLPNVVHLPRPAVGEKFVIVGDLHGHFGDYQHIYKEHGEPKATKLQYLFNGDFVDRGKWGPEVLLSIYCLKLRFPNLVHLNRGNHEDLAQNKDPSNGFCDDHCYRAWGSQHEIMYALCRRSFEVLPLCHVVGGEVFVVHGGLPMDRGVTLKEIDTIAREKVIPVRKCRLLGYPVYQRVQALKDLTTVSGQRVRKGSQGVVFAKLRKQSVLKAEFDSRQNDEVLVNCTGVPELEPDVEILYETDEERVQNRQDRIFTSLLWSDPLADDGVGIPGPNCARGSGALFDSQVTRSFLRDNNLHSLVRSHQKTMMGYKAEQRSRDGTVIAHTVFSASNYPSGAGEPNGNKASVIMLMAADQGSPLVLKEYDNWHEDYTSSAKTVRPRGSTLKDIEDTSAKQLPSASALEQLSRLVFCARAKLLHYFHGLDKGHSGTVSGKEWASAMRACVIPDADFPWEGIAGSLATFDQSGECRYQAFLARYTNLVSDSLSRRWCTHALLNLAKELGCIDEDKEHSMFNFKAMSSIRSSNQSLQFAEDGRFRVDVAEAAWDRLDRDGSGRLTYGDLKMIINSDSRSDVDFEEDMVYALLAWLDVDKSGFVERSEFLMAMNEAANEPEFATETEAMFEMKECWAALQGVLRHLAAARCRASSFFKLMDRDGDGSIDRDEFTQGIKNLLGDGSEEMATFDSWEPILWGLFDVNLDGAITYTEFMDAVLVYDAKDDWKNGCVRRSRASTRANAFRGSIKARGGRGSMRGSLVMGKTATTGAKGMKKITERISHEKDLRDSID